MSNPEYSIIVPVYKVEPYLRQCVDSVLCQTFVDFELILVDDGSPDQCPAICDEYAEKDGRVHVIHKQNGGQSDARNTGVEAAKGEYLIFLDSDDWWEDEHFLRGIEDIKSNCDVIYFAFRYIYRNRTRIDPVSQRLSDCYENGVDFLTDALRKDPMFMWFPWLCAIKTELWNSNGLHFPIGHIYEDIPTMYKAILAAKSGVAVAKKSVNNYRCERQGSAVMTVSLKTAIDHADMSALAAHDVESRTDLPKELRERLLNNFASGYLWILTDGIRLGIEDRKKLFSRLKQDRELIAYIKTGKRNRMLALMVKAFGFEVPMRLIQVRRWAIQRCAVW